MAEKKMSRVKRFLLLGGLGMATVIALGAGSVFAVSSNKLSKKVVVDCDDIAIPTDKAALERGAYLARHVMLCADCHGEDLGGFAVVDAQPIGRIYAPNITSGSGSVVKDYEPKDWVRVIRHGVGKDGRRMLLMPSEDYWNFSDSDLGAVIAYIQSVPAVDRENKSISLGPVGRLLVATGEIQFAYEKIDHDSGRPDAQPGPTKEWGEVMIGACIGCHGPGLSGGKIPGGDPAWPAASNITLGSQGIGDWSYDDFVKAMREGKRPDGTELQVPMPWPAYAGMKDDDLKALWAYMKTMPEKPTGNR